VSEASGSPVHDPRSDVQKLSDAIGRTREIGRFRDGDDRTAIAVYSSHSDTGYRVLISQKDDPDQTLVLTPNELRWLVNVMFGVARPEGALSRDMCGVRRGNDRRRWP
jgi:hypothetical protein